ncbi:hypothetical protein BCF11_3617 [Collimonas sp. PA-H2]|uniref:hypothetical protein n=1 Tax=Collimonas sp. PA-H2 TaxID=1881062 RepID=UPI000BF33BC9|nr:hypothetical protein [Collimonas sp. PA-H2]PFH11175.1 hypothetical protein BCF11_3617 [Collimonas sp. PA-H2]
MKLLRYAAFIAFAFTATLSSVQAQQTVRPTQQATAAQKAEVRRMLISFHADTLTRIGMKKGFDLMMEEDPQSEKFLRQIMDSITPDQLVDKLTSVYVKYYPQDVAQASANFFESPVGVKTVNAMVREISAGKKVTLETAHFSPFEQQTLMSFYQSSAGRAFSQLQSKASAEAGAMLHTWGEDIVLERMRKAYAPLLKEFDSQLTTTAGDSTPVSFTPVPEDAQGDLFKQIAAIIMNNILQSKADGSRYRAELQQIGYETLLSPQNLVTQAGIAEGKDKLVRMGAGLDQLLQSSEDRHKTYVQKLSKVALPSKYKAVLLHGAEEGYAESVDDNIRYGENQRSLIALYQRVLDFAEARLGRVTVSDNALLFSDTADLDIYHTLIAQINAESVQENALIQDARNRKKKSLQSMR